MKMKTLLILIIIISVVLTITGCSASCPDIGTTASDFTLPTADGKLPV